MKVSVVIATYNKKDYLRKCLTSLMSQTHKPDELILVDNGSTDGTAEMIKKRFPDVKLISLPWNLGLCKGYNIGFKNARCEYVMILDDDSILPKNWIKTILADFKKEPKTTGVITSSQKQKIGNQKGYEIIGKEGGYVHTFLGGGSIFKKEVLDKVGYFYEDYYRYAQEPDLSARIINAGYRIKRDTSIFSIHLSWGVTNSPDRFFHYVKANLWFIWRYFSEKDVIIYTSAYLFYFFWLAIKKKYILTYFKSVAVSVLNIPNCLRTREVVHSEDFKKEFNIFKFIRLFVIKEMKI